MIPLNIMARRISSVLTLFCSFAAAPILAEPKASKKTVEIDPKNRDIKKNLENESNGANSDENRGNKDLTIVGEFGLVLGDMVNSGPGIHIGYFASPRIVVEVDYFSASGKNSDTGESSEISLATIRTKYFIGDSFFVNGGLGKRTLFQKDLGLIETSSDRRREFQSTSIVGEVAIGNRWQWSRFTLGYDWIGYVMPFSQLRSSEKFGPTASEEFKARARVTQEKDSSAGNWLLLRLGIGLEL